MKFIKRQGINPDRSKHDVALICANDFKNSYDYT